MADYYQRRCANLSDEAKEEIIALYKKYPFIVPSDEYKRWEGVIYHQDTRFHLLLNTPNYPSLKGYSVFCSHKLQTSSHSSGEKVFKAESLFSFLNEVESYLICDNSSQNQVEESTDLERLRSLAQIVSDVEKSVGRSNVDSVDPRTKWIRLKYVDSVEQDNFIKVGLDENYPETVLRVLDVDLPEDLLSQFGQMRRLGEMYSCFIETVESLMPFWKMTSDLAMESWIIEPLEPTRKDTHRRIFLSDNLSVQLLFNPLNVDSMPDIKFLGSLGAVSLARETYQRNLQETGWWCESSVVENLCRLLVLSTLPKKGNPDGELEPSSDANDNESNDCAICYETSTEGETLPAKWCSNKNCSGRFHHCCLIEWLNSVATSKTSFDHISGPCPHCDEKIFCPIKLN